MEDGQLLATVTSAAVRPRGALMTDGSHQSRVEQRRGSAGLSLMMRAAPSEPLLVH